TMPLILRRGIGKAAAFADAQVRRPVLLLSVCTLPRGKHEMTKDLHAFLILWLLSFFLAGAAQASTICGRVTGPLGAAVRNAQVRLLDGSRPVATATSDSTGNYELQDVKTGRFRLHAAAATFSATDSDSFFVADKETAVRNIVLALPEIRQEVVV